MGTLPLAMMARPTKNIDCRSTPLPLHAPTADEHLGWGQLSLLGALGRWGDQPTRCLAS